jgi:hypothetical protein
MSERASETRARRARASEDASDVAEHESASSRAKRNGSETFSFASQAWQFLDGQVQTGAVYLRYAASSAHSAAGDLEKNLPKLAELVGGLADGLDDYAAAAADKSAEDIWRDFSDFTRKRPAIVFGLAALAGFVAYRAVSSVQDGKPVTDKAVDGEA